jgi:hypothetical protein
MKAKKTRQNRKQLHSSVMTYIKFWSRPSLRGELEDKGGSFNVELYFAYLRKIYE